MGWQISGYENVGLLMLARIYLKLTFPRNKSLEKSNLREELIDWQRNNRKVNKIKLNSLSMDRPGDLTKIA